MRWEVGLDNVFSMPAVRIKLTKMLRSFTSSFSGSGDMDLAINDSYSVPFDQSSNNVSQDGFPFVGVTFSDDGSITAAPPRTMIDRRRRCRAASRRQVVRSMMRRLRLP